MNKVFGILLLSLLIALFNISDSAFAKNWNAGGDASAPTVSKDSGFNKFNKHGNGWKKHNYRVLNDKSKARAGVKYQRFELRAGDCFPEPKWDDCKTDRNRVEFVAQPNQKPEGQQCYGFSLMLDKTFQAVHPTTTMIGQVHQIDGPRGTYLGFPSYPQIASIKVDRKKLQFIFEQTFGDRNNVKTRQVKKNLADVSDILGKWTDISFCLNFGDKNIDIWVNGEKKPRINQPPVRFMPKSIYFKYGIYNTFVSGYKKRWDKEIPTLIVFYDEVRRGGKATDVDANLNPELRPID